MQITPHDVSSFAGIALVGAGTLIQFGPGWACIATGGLLIGLTLLSLVYR